VTEKTHRYQSSAVGECVRKGFCHTACHKHDIKEDSSSVEVAAQQQRIDIWKSGCH